MGFSRQREQIKLNGGSLWSKNDLELKLFSATMRSRGGIKRISMIQIGKMLCPPRHQKENCVWQMLLPLLRKRRLSLLTFSIAVTAVISTILENPMPEFVV